MSVASIIEANYLINGNSTSELPPNLKVIGFLAKSAPKFVNPEQWRLDAIERHLKNNKLDNMSCWQERLMYALHCQERYKRGIPVDKAYLTAESNRLKVLEQSVRSNMPAELFNKGKIDQLALKRILPLSILRNWPVHCDRNGNRGLCFNNNSLKQIDHDIARLLLAQKEVYSGRIIKGISVKNNGLHNAHTLPYALATGRDNHTGSCIPFLPKKYREHVFNPKAGETLVLIDYEQQEPGIAASFANDQRLINLYLSGDIYANFAADGMARKQVKRQVLAHLYGQDKAFKTKVEQEVFACFNHYFNKVNDDLDRRASLAYEHKEMICHDWRMSVSNHSRILSVRNWPIQTTGGVILRKACQLLDEAKLPVIAAFHDAVLLKIPTSKLNEKIQLATQLMEDASLFILQNLKLRVSVEAIYQRGKTNDK